MEKTSRAEAGVRGATASKWNSLAAKKSSRHDKSMLPVPETDTGREVENTKGREITLSKELGKMAP